MSDLFESFKFPTAPHLAAFMAKQPSSSGSAMMAFSAASPAGRYGSGVGYKTPGVRSVPLALHDGAGCYDTTAEATYSGKYPLARYLYVYLNKKPGQPPDPLMGEFIKSILSRDGQTLAEKGGFYSITNIDREADLNKLGILTAAR